MIHKAIYALYPEAKSTHNNKAYDALGVEIPIDMELVNSWVDPDAYKQKRVAEYPSIGEQLDALFHAGVFPSDMAAQIQAIKDKYPKV